MSKGTTVLSASQPAQLEQAKIYFNQAVNFIKTQQYQSAERLLKRVLKIIPHYSKSYQLLSVVAEEQGRLEYALGFLDSAIMHQPGNLDYYYNRARLYQQLNRHDRAISELEKLIRKNVSYYHAYIALGRVLHMLQRYSEAVVRYEQGLELIKKNESVWPDLSAGYVAIIWHDLSLTYAAMKNFEKALKCLEVSLHLNPKDAKIYAARGKIYRNLCKWKEARDDFMHALQCNPGYQEAYIPLFICKNQLCEWDNYEALFCLTKENLSLAMQTDQVLPVSSFLALSLPFTPQEQFQIAKYENQSWLKSTPYFTNQSIFKHEPRSNPRVRIAYISSSFRDFPTGHLTQDLYALHDRERFEVFVYSYGNDDASSYRQKIQQGCDHFIDIKDYSIEQACQKIYADKIDILIDLMGATAEARWEINASRPAPVNVRYLGAPTTSGAEYFDYFISDEFITPAAVQSCFTEQLVFMPHSYQINPLQQTVSADIPSRAECGLPETGIVFCAFNNSYKIEPMIFKSWMNILQAVDGSVLWLQASGVTQTNLIQEAQHHNITAERLIFATRMTKERHLARHVHADLYLDTHYYNAHTTASDALWMNVPVITYPGDTFQSRVAGSLLHSSGMQELIMPDMATYEATAISLAQDPVALTQLKQKLKQQSETCPLFDTKRFVRNLERAYITMMENYKHNKKAAIVVQE